MKYLAIDIETLGLDPDRDDVIEFGAVYDDGVSKVDDLKSFRCYLTRPGNRYTGDVYAMSLHSLTLKRISEREIGYEYLPFDLLDEVFAAWMEDHGIRTPTIVGENVANTDMKFLSRIGFGKLSKFNHRVLDVGSMFVTKGDQAVPSLQECLRRSQIQRDISNVALEDAMDVVRCVRYALGTEPPSADSIDRPAKSEVKVAPPFFVTERLQGEDLGAVARFNTLIEARDWIRKAQKRPLGGGSMFKIIDSVGAEYK